MTRTLSMLVLGTVAMVGLVGCSAAPMVEFASPRIMMHVEDKITSVEAIHGSPKIVKIDDRMYRVEGTGEVRINEFHLVEVEAGKIRVHGVDIESRGAMRDVFVEKDKVIDGVHPDKVAK
jgi:hypothetical protein